MLAESSAFKSFTAFALADIETSMLNVIAASSAKNAFLDEFMKLPLALAGVAHKASDCSVFRLMEGTIIVFNKSSQLAEVAVRAKKLGR